MSADPTTAPIAGPEPTPFVDWCARNHKRIAQVLLGIAGVLALAALLFFRAGRLADATLDGGSTSWLNFGILASLLTLCCFGVGLWLIFQPDDPESNRRSARLAALVLATSVGFTIALMAIVFQIRYLTYLTQWVSEGNREHSREVMLIAFSLVAGLFLGFAGVQLARTEERTDPALRRILYGYGAFVNSMLLLLILVVLNVVLFFRLPNKLDTTATAMFSVSDETAKFVSELKSPVQAYLIMSDASLLTGNVRAMLDKLESLNPKFKVEYLSPGLSAGRIFELREQFPVIGDQRGLLVVYGEAKPPQHAFISQNAMVGTEPSPMGREAPPKETFLGEEKLLSELRTLADDKNKPVVYFATGHGEMSPSAGPGASPSESIGQLMTYLAKRNVTTKTLEFPLLSPTPPDVPEDATIVVVAGPKQPWRAPEVDKLLAFAAGKGKIVLMLDAVPDRQAGDVITKTGFETMLAGYNLDIEQRLLMSIRVVGNKPFPERGVIATVAPAAVQKNPIGGAFARSRFGMPMVRPIRESSSDQRNPRYQAEELLVSPARAFVWKDTRDRTAEAFVKLINELADGDAKLKAEYGFPVERACVTMLVSEMAPPTEERAPPTSKPELAVFGTSMFLSDEVAGDMGEDTRYFDLFGATIDWLRDRPQNIGVPPKPFAFYTLNPEANTFNLYFAPPLLFALGIVGMGLGVWLVRRR